MPWPLCDPMRWHAAREEVFHCDVLIKILLNDWENTPWDNGFLVEIVERQRVAQGVINEIERTGR
jgi:hypothetical protein